MTPQVCLQKCRVNSCTLSKYYAGHDDETRAAEELNCVLVNANDARDCEKLHAECGKALSREHAASRP